MPRRRSYVAPVDERQIGRRLRELRERQGLSQTKLADQLGINQTLVSQYEQGKLRMHGALIAAMARALKVSADDVLGLSKLPTNGVRHDRRILRRLDRIEKLSKTDKQAVLKTLDLILKQRDI